MTDREVAFTEVPGDISVEVLRQSEKHDKSFIIVLDRMKEQKLRAVQASHPEVTNQVIDGYKQGHYDCILEVIAAFKRYG